MATYEQRYFKDKIQHDYKLMDEKIIKCATCRAELLKIIKIKDSSNMHMIQAICPDCKERSFIFSIQGEIMIDACEGFVINDTNAIEENKIFKYIIGVRNVKTRK